MADLRRCCHRNDFRGRRVRRFVAGISAVLASAELMALPVSDASPAKVVSQYALTSANDFPQRDPCDWRLLGSNDGGDTWHVVDERKSIVFSRRHQRLVFKTTNRTGYNAYRLVIQRVREPSEANSVQLAEIEPLGPTEGDVDAVPIFADRVTAHGENPNLERAICAFDGQVETKWLDYADDSPGTRSSWIQWQYTEHAGLVISNVAQLLQLRGHAARGYPVTLDGWMVGTLAASNQCCLLDGTGDIVVQLPSAQRFFPPGQRVRVEGVSRLNGRSVGIAGPRFSQLGPDAPAAPAEVGLGERFLPQDGMKWVEVTGELRFVGRAGEGLRLELADRDRRINVQVLHATGLEKLPASGSQVQVRGLCEGVFNAQGERVVGTIWAADLDSVCPRGQAPAQPLASADASRERMEDPGHRVLTTVHEVRQLDPERLAENPGVRLQGVVTDLYGTYFEDATGGIEIWIDAEGGGPIPTLGDYVVIEGTGDWVEGDSPAVQVARVEILGKGQLPRATPSSWSKLASGHGLDQWVEIKGVVRSSDGSHVLLDCEGEQALGTIRSAPASQVDGLVDAMVRMRGVGTTARDEHQVRGIHLIVPSIEFVEVIQAPASIAALPALEISSLLRGRGPMAFRHRVKTEGVLTLQDGGRYFIQDATGSAMAVAKQSITLTRSGHWVFWQSVQNRAGSAGPKLKPGDRVQVVGFPETRGYSLVLAEALIIPVGHSAAVKPVHTDARGILAGNLDSTLISLEATLLSQKAIGQRTVMEFRDGQSVFEAFIQDPGVSVAPGSRVRVTGICKTEPTQYREFGKSIGSFSILVGSAADLAILERPPWWNLKHTLAVAGALAGVLVVAICWIGLLHRVVDQRTTQLQREIEERKRMELENENSHKQLMLTSRMAGMAEVATHVLHNVGNVLNGVNLLGAAIVDDLHSSKAGRVRNLGRLLTSQRESLDRFVVEDPRGKQLPEYVTWLGNQLHEEQSELVGKFESLTNNIHHLKEIVATQHAYAKISGVLENVEIESVVEDALRMQGEGLAHHKIRLTRDYAKVPPLLVDRHKVLQILFNLLQNARHACDRNDAVKKCITVRTRAGNEQRVEVSVTDNGMGIAPENLERIFSQGFSTRKDGHGFGLHSSLLMAQDMGGNLTAHSDGLGKGATFVLELLPSPEAARRTPRRKPPRGRPGALLNAEATARQA